MAVVALATLLFMALSFTIVPNEGADSAFELKLQADEPRIKYLQPTAGESTTFDMDLTTTNMDGFDHEIALNVHDVFYGGGSDETTWNIEFLDPDMMQGDWSVYYFGAEDTLITITLEITYLGSVGGDIVSLSIVGLEDSENDTRLSPVGGQANYFEFISVVTSTPYFPFVEPGSGQREGLDLLEEIEFSIFMRNLGSMDDEIYISGWGVYFDNGDGIFSPAEGRAGEDIRNDNFEIILKTSSGVTYNFNQKISLTSGDSEELKVIVKPVMDNTLVPQGMYFIQITADSDNGEPYSAILSGDMEEIALPDFSILNLEISEDEVEEGESVTFTATVNVDATGSGNLAYAFYVDGDVIEKSKGTEAFDDTTQTLRIVYKWKAKTGDDDRRIIKFEVDPDNAIEERDENNNQRSAPLDVTEEETPFPWWIIAVAIAAIVVAGGAYWFIVGGGVGGNLKIEEIKVDPMTPKVGEGAAIVAVIKNNGSTFPEGDRRNIVVSYYVDYESIGEKSIDLASDDFESGDTREVSLAWEPDSPGIHNLNVAVDIDDEESDVTSKDVEIEE